MATVRSAVIRFAAVFAATGISIPAVQIVVNGGFETGNFTGWTLSGNTANTGVDAFSPHSGMFSAFLGPQGSLGFLDQVLPTNAGTKYELSYFLQGDGGVPNEFRAQINNTILFDQTNMPLQPYTQYIFDFTATSTSDLKFGFRDDPGFLRLDDITVNSLVNTVPETSNLSVSALVLVLLGFGVRHQRRGGLKQLKSPLTSQEFCVKKDSDLKDY
jgi:hypothetical protein